MVVNVKEDHIWYIQKDGKEQVTEKRHQITLDMISHPQKSV